MWTHVQIQKFKLTFNGRIKTRLINKAKAGLNPAPASLASGDTFCLFFDPNKNEKQALMAGYTYTINAMLFSN